MLPMVDYCADMGQFEEDCSIPEYNMHHLELDQVTKVISYHPRFLDHFLRTQNFIMKGDGPLPYDYRYYLAIIAAARHQCPYLVKMYEKEFVNQGGNLEWLNGLDYIPSKLRAIYEINKILAHRPWLLRKEHIESLTKGKNSWSLSEVVHAMVLLSHFHSLSSFVFSCGLTQKLDGLSSPKLKTSPSNVTTTNKIATTTTTPINNAHNTITINNVSDSQQQHDNGGGGCGGGIEVAMISSPQHPLTYQHQQHQSVPPPTVTVAAAVEQQQQQKTVLNEINLNQYNNTISNSVSMTNSDNGVNTNNLIAPLNIVGNGGGVGGGNVNGAVHVIDNGAITINTANALNGVNKKNALPSATVEVIMERMKVLSQNPNECSEAELSNRFKNVEMQTAELPAAPLEALVEVQHVISHYVEDSNFTYRDFARRGAENIPNTFRIQDYSWDDHGYSLVNGLYEDVGTLLDQKFRCAYNLTYFTMGGWKNVDTSKFRRAIWNYIHCIYGIRHDDYDYGEVNQLLDRPLKMFIKTACCFPDRITTKDYDSILVELQDSEKVHVNLMIMEARNQAELLYALREIMRYMT